MYIYIFIETIQSRDSPLPTKAPSTPATVRQLNATGFFGVIRLQTDIYIRFLDGNKHLTKGILLVTFQELRAQFPLSCWLHSQSPGQKSLIISPET